MAVTTEDDLRLRHLADVQAVITRMSQNSFIVRGWSVTLVSVVFAILGTRSGGSRMLALFALVPALIFWGLDTYYLRQERRFRCLYAAVARQLSDDGRTVEPVPLFDMEARRYVTAEPRFVATLFTGHVIAIPAMLAAVVLGYAVFAS